MLSLNVNGATGLTIEMQQGFPEKKKKEKRKKKSKLIMVTC